MKKIKTESGLIVRKTGGGQDVVPGISISRISSHDMKPKLSPQQSSKPVSNKVIVYVAIYLFSCIKFASDIISDDSSIY